MNRKQLFLTIYNKLLKIYQTFRNKTVLFLEFLNPYKKEIRQPYEIPMSRIYYKNLISWIIKILFNATILWASLGLLGIHNMTPPLCIGFFILVWLVGGILKNIYNLVIEGIKDCIKQLPSRPYK